MMAVEFRILHFSHLAEMLVIGSTNCKSVDGFNIGLMLFTLENS